LTNFFFAVVFNAEERRTPVSQLYLGEETPPPQKKCGPAVIITGTLLALLTLVVFTTTGKEIWGWVIKTALR
jgi:hypothetical protein